LSSSGNLEDDHNIFSEINSLPKILLNVRPDHADLKIDKNGIGDCKLRISSTVNNIPFPPPFFFSLGLIEYAILNPGKSNEDRSPVFMRFIFVVNEFARRKFGRFAFKTERISCSQYYT
jgi:hypothetical protein